MFRILFFGDGMIIQYDTMVLEIGLCSHFMEVYYSLKQIISIPTRQTLIINFFEGNGTKAMHSLM